MSCAEIGGPEGDLRAVVCRWTSFPSSDAAFWCPPVQLAAAFGGSDAVAVLGTDVIVAVAAAAAAAAAAWH